MTFSQELARIMRRATFEENQRQLFTPRQLDKLVELVACAYIYGVDYPQSTDPQTQKLLKNIYFILTGNDDPEDER